MKYTEITINTAKKLIPIRTIDSHKGTYGKVINIAGCFGYQGAAYLSSVSALKVGAGLVTLATTKQVINNLAGNCPWVTFLPLKDSMGEHIATDAFKDLTTKISNYDVVSIGSGLSVTQDTKDFVSDVIAYLNKSDTKSVIDADAINILAQSDLTALPNNSVITPLGVE